MTMSTPNYSDTDAVARDYYNDESADRFYDTIWGGEDIHVGMYLQPDESIFDASRRTVERMISLLPALNERHKVLDIGAGYGGSARLMCKQRGAHVVCLNISEVENEKNRRMNREQGLDSKIEVVDGTFENLPFPENHFDVVWSQDAVLHSGDRRKVLQEVDRVTKKGGYFTFTDPMQSDDCPKEALQPVLERIHLSSMGSPGFYQEEMEKVGWKLVEWVDMSEQLVNHYSRVREEVIKNEQALLRVCKREYIERMKVGLQHWVDTGRKGHLKWGIFVFHKPEA